MNNKPSIIAMIPARRGSTRLKQKNLALLNGRPLISYAIEAAKRSGVFDKVIVNSEDDIFKDIACEFGAEFYKRPCELATSETKSDEVIYDFMKKYSSDIVAWVNPTSPLQSAAEIKNVIEYFINEDLDSLVTVKNEQVHCVFKNKPLNFSLDGLFAKTQDLEPLMPFVYSVMMWRTKTFQKFYKKQGYAFLCGKVGYYPVSKLSTIIIKTEEDFKMAEYLLKGMQKNENFKVKYAQGAL